MRCFNLGLTFDLSFTMSRGIGNSDLLTSRSDESKSNSESHNPRSNPTCPRRRTLRAGLGTRVRRWTKTLRAQTLWMGLTFRLKLKNLTISIVRTVRPSVWAGKSYWARDLDPRLTSLRVQIRWPNMVWNAGSWKQKISILRRFEPLVWLQNL